MARFVCLALRLLQLKLCVPVWIAFALVCSAPAAELKPLLGPVEELAILDDFATNSQTAWRTAAGENASFKLELGRNIPGVASSLMLVQLSRKDATDKVAGHNWFSLKMDGSPRYLLGVSPTALP
jgi:hypothetical protein